MRFFNKVLGITPAVSLFAMSSVFAATPKFILTTVDNTSDFSFNISAAGNFTVDCGDGSSVQVINKNNTDPELYSCNYASPGTYNIGFDGSATGYSVNANNAAISFYIDWSSVNPEKIAAISGSLGAIFGTIENPSIGQGQPRFIWTFAHASNMISNIPPNLFSGIYGEPTDNIFNQTFYGCSGLTGNIPDNLFSGLYGEPKDYMFFGTFNHCSNLTGDIPETLFTGIYGAPAPGMFSNVFEGCSNLTGQIPGNLFAGISGAPASAMFQATFAGCSGLTGSIPGNLFAGISGPLVEHAFFETFSECSNLSGFIPGNLFSGITPANVYYPMYRVFYGTNLDTSCPAETNQVITGFESYFDGHVACSVCPDTYPYIDSNSSDINECYRDCTTNDVEHATNVSGKYYYGDKNMCSANQCASGWHKEAGFDLSTAFAQTEQTNSGTQTYSFITNDGDYHEYVGDGISKSQTYYGISQNNEWAVSLDDFDFGVVTGMARCSTYVGNNHYGERTSFASLPDETGREDAMYCYCKATKYKPLNSDEWINLTSSWMFHYNSVSSSDCASVCVANCGLNTKGDILFRNQLFANVTPNTDFCKPDTVDCPIEYPLQDEGAQTINDCYRNCAVNDVEHAASVSGKYYYGDKNQCTITSCANGWALESRTGISPEISNQTFANSALGAIDNNGNYSSVASEINHSKQYYGLTENNSWALETAEGGIIYGKAICSTTPGSNEGYPTYGNATTLANMSDETGNEGARYCYCNINGYKENYTATLQNQTSAWIFLREEVNGPWNGGNAVSGCASTCSPDCARLMDDENSRFREVIFGTSTITQCVRNGFICDTNKWWHIGDGENDKMCLLATQPTTPKSIALKIGTKTYYIPLSTNPNVVIHENSDIKMHIKYGSTTYNAHDESVGN